MSGQKPELPRPLNVFPSAELAHGADKLMKLEKYLPGVGGNIYEYAKFLGKRVHEVNTPEGFVMAARIATYSLSKGKDESTGKRIDSRLTGYLPPFYEGLFVMTSPIAHAIYPEDFAKKVDEFIEKITE